ncbi:divalent-cation tolerance protein CutA [Candidatus Curtissbacteria bacterium]|nr:divalent-cation tolerance protein CutA [Candidatus Curtissbacteria bacterium]
MILILTTFPNKAEAVKIGDALLEKRLIACYNLFPVESAYWWHAPSKSQHEPSTNSSEKASAKIRLGKGKTVKDKEFSMIIKTKDENFKKVESFIQKNHSYEVPEIVAIKAEKVTKPYLDWLNQETKQD